MVVAAIGLDLLLLVRLPVSPMSKSCDTTRAPGLSPFWRIGLRRRLTSGSRYSVTTSTSLKSSGVIFSTSPCLKVIFFFCVSVSFSVVHPASRSP